MPKRDRHDDPDISLAAMIVVVGTVLTFAIVVFLSAVFFRAENDEVRRKIVDGAPKKIRSLRAEQTTILESYRWIDQEAGVVAIPIDRAVEIMVAREDAAGGEGE